MAQENAHSVPHPAAERRRVGWLRLLSGLLGAPLAWIVQMSLSYMLASTACYPREAPLVTAQWEWLMPALAVISLICFAVGCLSLLSAWRSWQEVKHEAPNNVKDRLELSDGRTSFTSMLGVFSNSIFLAGILFTGSAMLTSTHHHFC